MSHNGDFDGDSVLVVDPGAVEVDGPHDVRVTVPTEDLFRYVAVIQRHWLIAAIEELPDDQLLLGVASRGLGGAAR